ncbi:ABC-type Fe3+ transport system, permease component [Thioflavicoccus mobilis 8321]|uniref:ABC-type Fe3+ transport system, permease component n=1 Tax=Thioflavicoccus mobilis 8321 TaxID=765912 RepID=L0GYT7_9GAMM|nr:iron ABC transporter permease [Thioflavicoccus mobilis]AGA90535.1 ABC-type Fe3+ transport system, permease component [Thioflavicoccus mobilis 8321]
MRLPRWGQLLVWLVFAVAVYLPAGQLILEALSVGRPSAAIKSLFLTSSQWSLLGRSVTLAAGASLLAVLIGVPYALLCEKTDLPGRAFFSLAYLVPLLIPPYLHAIVWGRLLARNGPVNQFLMDLLGLPSAPVDVHSLGGAVVVLALAYFPFVTLLTISGLRTVDASYEEAALMQRCAWRAVTRVSLPMVRPHVGAAALFVFVFAIIDFGVADVLRVQVYPVEIFIQFSALYDEQAAIMLSIPLLVVTALAIALQVHTMRGRSYVSLQAGRGTIRRYRLGGARGVAAALCSAILLFSVLVPVGALMDAAGPLQSYQRALDFSLEQILVSFVLALIAAVVMTALSVAVAVALFSAERFGKVVAEYLSQLAFAIPPIVLGIGMIKLWNRPETDWLYGSALIVVLGCVAHFVPFTIRVVYSNLQQFNPRLLDAAALTRRSSLTIGWRILLPLLRNGLLTALFIGFVLSMGELGVTLLVIPPGTETIPIKIYNFMHYGAEQTVAALGLMLIAVQLLLAIALFGFGRWLGPGAK